jgi:hypothetical protein
MPLNIDEIHTEVRVEPEHKQSGEQKPAAWEEMARLRDFHERLLSDCERTSAFGNED